MRQRTFTDSALRVYMKKYGGDVPRTAEALGSSVTTVYRHARRIDLTGSTRTKRRQREEQPGDRELIDSVKPGFTLARIANAWNVSYQCARAKFLRIIDRLWTAGSFPDYPKPYCVTDVRIFNALRALAGRRDDVGAPMDQDPDVVAETAGLPTYRLERYMDRYLDLVLQRKERQRAEKPPSGRRHREPVETEHDEKGAGRAKGGREGAGGRERKGARVAAQAIEMPFNTYRR